MSVLQNILRRIPRIPWRMYREMRDWTAPVIPSIWLWWNNRNRQQMITAPGGPVVSMTSYGRRIKTAYLAIESIARGDLKPSRMILWLDDHFAFNNPPMTLQRLMRRGLEVKLCDNFGPHKKYYPYVESEETFDVPLVTADDDILYPTYWLKRLFDAFQAEAGIIHCHRAHVHTVTEEGVARYHEGGECRSAEPSFLNLALGFSGVLFPPAFLSILKNAGKDFQRCCLMADDVWLHAQALRAGYKVKQVRREPIYVPPIPGTQGVALWKRNLHGGNDRQMEATYTAEDVRIMLACSKS
jgi:hypothetical protein